MNEYAVATISAKELEAAEPLTGDDLLMYVLLERERMMDDLRLSLAQLFDEPAP